MAGCDRGPVAQSAPEPITRRPSDGQQRVACAVGGDAPAWQTCTVDRRETATDGTVLTVRHPDGGFRRFVVDGAGHLDVADGAERAQVLGRPGGVAEVRVGDDRYRFPAR